MNLTGNTILITGATSGIGLAFAKKFYALGNTVIICGRREERLKEIAAQFPGIITTVCDVSKDEERKELFRWASTKHNGVNILMNNAGVQYAFDLHNEISLEKMHNEIESNFAAPVHLSSLFASHLKQKQHAAIINISSGLSFVPIAFMPVYCATKAAIHSFTLSLRHQLKDTGVKVFEVAPPSVDTELGHDRRADKSESHGGMPVDEFLKEAMEGLKNDVYETLVGNAKNLREKNEMMFSAMNG